MDPRLTAIVWAQWRSLWNMYPRANKAGLIFTAVFGVFWYGIILVAAVILGRLAALAPVDALNRFLPIGLLVAFLVWQVIPLLLASTGATLDVRKLLVYPVAHRSLFAIEVMLRLTTGIDVLLVMTGVALGLLVNHAVPLWGPLWLLPFVLFNLTLSAGIRDLLARLFARKRFREIAVLGLISLAALPQLLVVTGVPPAVVRFFTSLSQDLFPWTPIARLALGHFSFSSVALTGLWTAAAFLFGRWQFETGLKFDQEAAESTPVATSRRASWWDGLFTIPSKVFPDPLGVLVEKEIRTLCRAPRFRLVFFMGFTFGLLIWMPLAFGRHGAGPSWIGNNFLTFVSVYSLMLLGEVSFYNTFGFDRSATQLYFLVPIRFPMVLLAKNITAASFVFLELIAIALACLALRLPLPVEQIPEAFCVAVVLTIYLMAVGNLSSTRYPAPVDPSQSWRSRGAKKFHVVLLLIYPVISIPISLAYLARWAFESTWAFYGGLLVAAAIGGVVYWVAMDSALQTAATSREQILTALSKQDSPISLA
ncbi:MAG: hypothetical protein ABI693_18885 [Bryobacteraceae bacterium]